MRCAAIVFFVLGCVLDHVVAEEQEVEEGARVIVSTTEVDTMTGYVEKLTTDTLLIKLDGESRSVSVPLVNLKKIEISRGRRSRSQAAWSKAKWGALIGAVPGAVSLGLGHEQIGEDGASVGKAAALGAWSGGLFGGLIGVAIGAMSPGEAWEKVSPSFYIATTGQGAPGFSFAVTIGF